MNSQHLLALYEGRRIDPVIVCYLDVPLANALGAKYGRVRLSDQTMLKQSAHHPELLFDFYRALPATLRCGEYRQDAPNGAIVIYTDTTLFNRNFRAYVKCCSRGKLWVTSFNAMYDRQMRKERRKPWPVIREHD